jgi:hypothetical protein
VTGLPVARVGDVVATVSPATSFPTTGPPTATGSWSAAGVVPVPASGATAGAAKVLVGASCVFTFTGTTTSSPSSPFTSPPSTVTLTPRTRVLHRVEGAPLVNGDTASDAFGNKLTVASTATWRTA